MRTNSLHPDKVAARRKQYTRDNREIWKQLGYRMLSTMVHDDDRDEILAELEVKRCLRAQEMAEDKSSGTTTISHLSSRNISPSPMEKEMKDFMKTDAFKNCHNADEIEFCIEKAVSARRSYQGCINAEPNTPDGESKWRLYAKQVAFGNLASAWWRLAMVRYDKAEKKSVFMAKGTG
jgi:hypothetical protein